MKKYYENHFFCLSFVRTARGGEKQPIKRWKLGEDVPQLMIVYLRVGGLNVLPTLGDVLPQLTQRTQAQLPLQLASVPLLGS